MKKLILIISAVIIATTAFAQKKSKKASTVAATSPVESKLKIRSNVTRPEGKGWFIYGTAGYGIPFLSTNNSGPIHFTFNLTRAKLEALVDDFLKKTIIPCENCLKDAGVNKNKIQEVILVGGMTRMPKVQKLVQNIFGKVPNKSINPD